MIDATILIPTHDHTAFLPIAIRSALAQTSASFEVFVVGDGVRDETRRVMQRFADDDRVHFFEFAKGERHGECHRHVVLQESHGEIICYLSDDDILLPGHVMEMRRLLADTDFAHSTPVTVDPDGILVYRPADLALPGFEALIREGRNNFISLTGAAHTRSLYDRLPYGWRPAPPGTRTDIHMWQQIFALPDVRGVTSARLTAIHFPDPAWSRVSDTVRASALESWLQRALRPQGEGEIRELLDDAVWRAAKTFKLRSIEQKRALEAASHELELLRAPWWKKLGRYALRLEAARALRERLR